MSADNIPLDKLLKQLRMALTHLPSSIPRKEARYHFKGWAPHPEDIEMYGSTESALNHALEVTFAPGGQKGEMAPCPFEFEEQGPGLVAMVDALTMELHKAPMSAVLQKWAEDLWRAAVYHYKSANLPVSRSHLIGSA